MRTLAFFILGALTPLCANAASCELSTRGSAPQRVELYTSEGCSSCPPADRWMSSLEAANDRILLAFHVDYWDQLGWPDRFADARFSQRQSQLAARAGSRAVYTPEVAVEGGEYRGWRTALPAPAASIGPTLSAQVSIDQQINVQLAAASGYPKGARAFLAITESQLYTEVKAGENRGSRLRHDHVVRAFAPPVGLAQRLSLQLPADLNRDHARLNLWVEDQQGRTVQGLSEPLARCLATAHAPR